MWVRVTANFDYRRILIELLEYQGQLEKNLLSHPQRLHLKEKIKYQSELKGDLHSLSNSQLESHLQEFLATKKFLLVLDDVWIQRYSEWENLHKLLKQGAKGSRVLVTGRNTSVLKVMGIKHAHLLDFLPEDECLLLFESIAFQNHNIADNELKVLKELGRKIVCKCYGLPMAVKAMAGLLRDEDDANKWQNILDHEIWEAEEPVVLPALKLSYDHLPSHLKQCFAYCYIFPKGSVIDKGELVKLWKAQSFIHSKEGYTNDEIGRHNFDELLSRSFFQPSEMNEKQRYRMHDLIHDLVRSISSPHCYQVKDNKSCHVSQRSRHVSLLCKDVEKPVLKVIEKSNRLRTLLFPSQYLKDFGQALHKIFNTLKYLHTLDLSSSTLTELPNSVENLKLLHYLDLSRTQIIALPNSICNLYNLQTLKLLQCPQLFELPKDLGDLVNLEHLELDDKFWLNSSALPPGMGNLTSLQNLHAFEISSESGYRIDELKNMNCLTGSLSISKLENAVDAAEAKLKEKKRLLMVEFKWSNSVGGPKDAAADKKVLEDLQPHSNVEELRLFCYKGTSFPSWITGVLLPNLVSLSLNHCSKCKVLFLGELNHLRELRIKGMLELEGWPDVQYPSLSIMHISNCPNLKELVGTFPELKRLKIKKCDSLEALPVIPFLLALTLVGNPLLKDLRETMEPRCYLDAQGEFVEPTGGYLQQIKIINCPKLQALPKVLSPWTLEISGCPLLSTLIKISADLQHLALDACQGETLVKEIPESSSLHSLVISDIYGIKYLPKLSRLIGLTALYIWYCSDLVSLFKEEASFEVVPVLRLLSIWHCPHLETLPVQQLPTTIECLSIGSCASLKSLGPKEALEKLTSLTGLYIDDCPALQSLPSLQSSPGIQTSFPHMHIERCPLLLKQCQKDRCQYWSDISFRHLHIEDSLVVVEQCQDYRCSGYWSNNMHIPEIEIDSSSTQSSPERMEHTKPKASSSGIDIRDFEKQHHRNSLWFKQKDEGQTSKGKGVAMRNPSAEHGDWVLKAGRPNWLHIISIERVEHESSPTQSPQEEMEHIKAHELSPTQSPAEEMEHIKTHELSPTQSLPEKEEHIKPKASSAPWCRWFICSKGIDTREFEQHQQPNSYRLMQKDKGQTSKG